MNITFNKHPVNLHCDINFINLKIITFSQGMLKKTTVIIGSQLLLSLTDMTKF